ncbi:MAG: SAM-dependent methyltransferase [Streptosporangiaceae bacterium]|nr:SAM-dependent methyltransferase [Streptosporangiaceae bacterium]
MIPLLKWVQLRNPSSVYDRGVSRRIDCGFDEGASRRLSAFPAVAGFPGGCRIALISNKSRTGYAITWNIRAMWKYNVRIRRANFRPARNFRAIWTRTAKVRADVCIRTDGGTTRPCYLRRPNQIPRFSDGLELVEWALAPIREWHPDHSPSATALRSRVLGGVAKQATAAGNPSLCRVRIGSDPHRSMREHDRS